MAYPAGFAGAPAPLTPPTAAASPPPAAGHPAYAPVLTLAAILAHAAQLPQQQTIHENQAAADAAAHAQQQTIQGYTQALAKLLQGVAPQVQQGYQQAAQTEGALGSAFGGQLAAQGAPNQAQDQALLALSGGQANAGQVAAQTPGPALGNAAGWLGAGLPASGLNQAGAAFGAAASMLPGQVAGQGLQQIASIGARAQQADAGFAQRLDDLKAQYPGLLAKTAQQVQSQQAAQRSADSLARAREGALTGIDPATGQPTLEARKAQAAVDYQAAQVTIAQQKAAATEAYQKGELSARQYANQIAASRAASAAALGAYNAQTSRINARTSQTRAGASAAAAADSSASRTFRDRLAAEKTYGVKLDANWQPTLGPGGKPLLIPGFRYDAQGNPQKVTSAVSKPGGMTQSQWSSAYGKLQGKIDDWYHGVPELQDARGQVTRPQQDPLTYQQAFRRIKAQYPTLSPRKAYDLLNLYYQPGEGGRPLMSAAAQSRVDNAFSPPAGSLLAPVSVT